ncbi:hypothetical protein PTTG_28574 [Puccinia triticina 1-1 BBBD Race 1]|uniref:Uncharacterized protein n=1 Tax=Puccinia triticina (isolate 1-1 / race 1 (BBBD)) TaxID=630390 RepID=A0A180GAP8_PUCT1|nr:hypothetical protein PTTG_28574 [Puccinia triticina 1-1 BBBD Race 1]
MVDLTSQISLDVKATSSDKEPIQTKHRELPVRPKGTDAHLDLNGSSLRERITLVPTEDPSAPDRLSHRIADREGA